MAGHIESMYRTLLLPRGHSNSGEEGTIRLRHTLAKEGCKESQIALAKNLLTAASNSPEERDFNNQSAVYWLLQAAKTGQEEAFVLLGNCAKLGLGINAQNSAEVKKCLGFRKNEKIAYRVAYSIYRAAMAEPEELIPSDLFGDKIDLNFQSKDLGKEQTLIDETVSNTRIEETQNFSFIEVVNSVQSCLEGNVPLLSLKNAVNYSEYNWLLKRYIYALWDSLLRSLEKLVHNFSSLQISFSVLAMVIFLKLICSLISFSSETVSLIYKYEACLVSTFVLINMVSSSCFIINSKFGGDNLKRWLHLIKYFEPNINSSDIERKHVENKSINPFIIFFLASFLYIAFIPDKTNLINFADIGILYFMLTILIDRTVSHQRYFVNISLVLNVLICLYKANILQSFISNSDSLNLSMDYELGKHFYLHLSFLSCIALPFVLPYLYLKMSLGNKYWLLVLLPHLISLTWLNLMSYSYQNVFTNSFFNILSILVLLILSNYIGFFLTFIFFIFKNVFRKEDFFRSEFFILLLIFLLLYCFSSFIVKKFKISYASKLWSSIMCFALLILTLQSARPVSQDVENASEVISWEKYQQYCHHTAWYRSNTASVQISCLPLQGKDVSFEGTVTFIDMIQVKNNFQFFGNILPKSLNNWFMCVFGEYYSSSDEEHSKFYDAFSITDCHLHRWNVYKYQISIEIFSRTSPQIYLVVDHLCSSFIKTLKEGDTLKGVGRLESNVGGLSPVLTLKQASCVSCYTNTECNINYSQSRLPHFEFSIKNIVWYYFAPFIKYMEK